MSGIIFFDTECGYNIIKHDLKFLERHDKSVMAIPAIDTLSLSPFLFPKKPYHRLIKDDKLFSDQLNNPLNDALLATDSNNLFLCNLQNIMAEQSDIFDICKPIGEKDYE